MYFTAAKGHRARQNGFETTNEALIVLLGDSVIAGEGGEEVVRLSLMKPV